MNKVTLTNGKVYDCVTSISFGGGFAFLKIIGEEDLKKIAIGNLSLIEAEVF